MGLVSIETDRPLPDALLMMGDRAEVSRCTLHEIARAVVERRTRFAE
jgi:hypothetical protein